MFAHGDQIIARKIEGRFPAIHYVEERTHGAACLSSSQRRSVFQFEPGIFSLQLFDFFTTHDFSFLLHWDPLLMARFGSVFPHVDHNGWP